MNITLPAIGYDDLQVFYTRRTSAQGRDVTTNGMNPMPASAGRKAKKSSAQVSE
jgi:hypothetical protein